MVTRALRHACRVIGHNVLVAARSLASSRAVSSGWCSCAAAPQTVCAPSEGMHPIGSIRPVWGHSTRERRFHLIESIAPDQNGLMIADGASDPIRNMPRHGAGRPCPCPVSVGGAFRAFIGARPARACAAGPRRRRPTGVQPGLAGQSCTGEGALDPLGSMTPGVLAGVLHH